MRILLTFSVAFAAATLFALMVLPQVVALILGVILGILALSFLLRKRITRTAILTLGVAAGLLWCAGYQILFIQPARSLSGETITISGTATDYSEETSWGICVDAKITVGKRKVSSKVWLYTQQALAPGDEFTVEAELTDAKQDGNYYYWADGIYLLSYGKGEPEIVAKTHVPLRYFPRRIAHCLKETLNACVPADTLGYAVALSTGDRSGLSNLEKAHLKTAGIYHALALSGMHLTTLLGAVFLLVRKRRHRAYWGIPISILFTLITGAVPSMVRACVMQCLVLLAPLLDEEEDTPTSLGVAALLLMLQNPCCILGWGMQLSFTSMAGIMLLSEKLQCRMYGEHKAWNQRPWILRKLWRGITASCSATISATIASLPLMMLYFGMFSLVSPITNLLTGWAVTWAFRLSLLTGSIGTFLPGVASVLGWILAWSIRYISCVAGLLARIPFAALYTDSVYVLIWVAAFYSVFLLLIRTPRQDRKFAVPICCLLIIFSVCIGLSLLENMSFIFTVLDVGQGQCLLARVADQTVMIDCGGSSGEGTGDFAASYLDALGEQWIDLLILTHYDSDHVDGVPELMQRVHVGTILMPNYQPDSDIRQTIERAAANTGTEIRLATTDFTAEIDTCHLSIFCTQGADSENNESLSILLEHEKTAILVTGDMDATGERKLLREHTLPDIDILVAGHHGSKYSTSETLLNSTAPKIVVVSVGKNSYGHPAEETISRITATGAAIYRTDLHGTLRLREA